MKDNKKRVLIVEDDDMIVFMLQMCYEHLDCEVIGNVDTGEAAIDFVKHHAVDFVSMDIMLNSAMNGVEAAENIRSNNYLLPIIFVSANNDHEPRTKNIVNSTFLRKPIDLNDLGIAVMSFQQK
jgi:CheY-like chemotaxis protein